MLCVVTLTMINQRSGMDLR